jgi:4-aminobutyrate aminotransferase-like enzyme
MQGTLILGWQYRQKRKETVRFALEQATQLDGTIRPLARTLNLRLQEVANPSESTFFLTRRGRQAVEHALEIARAHLAASARCLEI